MPNYLDNLDVIDANEQVTNVLLRDRETLAYAATVDAKIGTLSDLHTTDKTNVVSALNEVYDDAAGKIGDLSDLNTSDKSSIVAAINETYGLASDNKDVLDNLNIYNVKDYGAKGDGVTDDTSAFNSIIALINGGSVKPLYIPEGTYNITSLTPITTGCEIFGCGAGSKLVITSGSGAVFDLSSWTNGSLHDLTIKDESDRNGLIKITTGNLVNFHDIWIDDPDYFFIIGRPGAGVGNVEGFSTTIRNIFGHVKHQFAKLYGSRSCTYFENCVVNSEATHSLSTAIDVSDQTGLDTLVVANCLFQRFYYGIAVNNGAGVTTSNFFIDNTIFDGIYHRAIQFNIYGKFYRAYFDGCWFTGMDANSYENVIVQPLDSGVVSGIHFDSCKFPFCYSSCITAISVSGLTVNNCEMPMYTITGINAQSCGGVTIVGNSIGYDGTNSTPPTTEGIVLTGSHTVLVASNRLGIATTPTPTSPYRFTGNLNIADAIA